MSSKYRPDIVEKRVLVTAKAYPQPSAAYRETVCVAGVTEEGQWIRLYPICFRSLEDGMQFKTYAWIRVKVWKADKDRRPESYHVVPDSLEVEDVVSTKRYWEERRKLLGPLRSASLEDLSRRQKQERISLGLIRPYKIQKLVIEPLKTSDWTSRELAKLLKQELFDGLTIGNDNGRKELTLLEKIPYRFAYKFLCEGPDCRGHEIQVISWEMMESYRKWREQYGSDVWDSKFREKYEEWMTARDLHFFMGNMAKHPGSWLIIGLFYPPRAPIAPARPSLWDTLTLPE